MIHRLGRWFDHNAPEPGRELRMSLLPPLTGCAACEIAGLSGIVGGVQSDPADS